MGRKTETDQAPSTFMGLTTGKFFITLGVLIVSMFGLAYLIVESRSAADADNRSVQQMVLENYDVDAVGETPNRKPSGYGLTISKGTTVHTCTGVEKGDVIAKKPITCNDGYVVQPKG